MQCSAVPELSYSLLIAYNLCILSKLDEIRLTNRKLSQNPLYFRKTFPYLSYLGHTHLHSTFYFNFNDERFLILPALYLILVNSTKILLNTHASNTSTL